MMHKKAPARGWGRALPGTLVMPAWRCGSLQNTETLRDGEGQGGAVFNRLAYWPLPNYLPLQRASLSSGSASPLAVKLVSSPTSRFRLRHMRDARELPLLATQVVPLHAQAIPPATARLSSAGCASCAV